MSIPPEVLFHRFFQSSDRHPEDRTRYKGKQDLDTIRPLHVRDFLYDLQNALNESLSDEKQNVPEHVPHSPFHFDYVESTELNALAFRDSEYSFIGMTMPLINTMWASCEASSKSIALGALLEIPPSSESGESILTVMFQNQLAFAVAHEYTHHVHGHLSHTLPGTEFFSEINNNETTGRLEDQAFEMDADGYSVYHLLANLIEGPRRQQATEILKCKNAHVRTQDEILFSSFVIAIGKFLHILPPVSGNYTGYYQRTHPIPAVRMRGIMDQAVSWCRQNDKNNLADFMSVDRFQTIMLLVEKAMSEVNGGLDWKEQTAFMKSDDGRKYLQRLGTRFRAHVQSLGTKRSQTS